MILNKKLYAITVAIPALILIGMTVTPLITVCFGQEITLETAPIDPRDLFRGDYVVLNYKINTITEPDKIPDEIVKDNYLNPEYRKKTLYAILKKQGDVYNIQKLSIEKPEDGIYLKCKPNYYYLRDNTPTLFLRFNIDRYFVPENTGMELEEASREGSLIAIVKVFRGYAILTGIKIKRPD